MCTLDEQILGLRRLVSLIYTNKHQNDTIPSEEEKTIANLSDISTITSKTREKDYKRFKWDIDDYIKLPYIENKKVLKNSNNTKKPHFLFGITTFKRADYLVELINSLIPTLKKEHFFTK